MTEEVKKPPALSQVWVLEATWTDIPEDVREEIQKLWMDCEYGNDVYYYTWNTKYQDGDCYPLINKYLSDRGITECLIHYWW